MSSLRIDRLHSEFHVPGEDLVPMLDEAVHRTIATALEVELLTDPLSDHFAVCIPSLRVRLDVEGPPDPAELSRRWARAVVDGIRRQIDEPEGPVVYRRPIDAHIDMFVCLASNNVQRAWAWKQIGLVAPMAVPRLQDLVMAMTGRPEEIPSVLLAVGDNRAMLGVNEWIELATAFATAHGRRPTISKTSTADSADALRPDGEPASPREVGAGSVATHDTSSFDQAVAFVPAHVWASIDFSSRLLVSRLTVSCIAPSQSRNEDFVHAVAIAVDPTAMKGESPVAEQQDAHTLLTQANPEALLDPVSLHVVEPSAKVSETVQPSERAPSFASGSEASTAERKDDSEVEQSAATQPESAFLEDGQQQHRSDFGGLLYLVHAITALDTFADDDGGYASGDIPSHPAELVARSLAYLAGAPINDPALLAASGWPEEIANEALPNHAVDPDQQYAFEALARRVERWVEERLPSPMPIDELINRPVSIELDPGWIEGTFPLTSVDIRLRIAGLDLDPGYVWWLGAVVRYRYVD